MPYRTVLTSVASTMFRSRSTPGPLFPALALPDRGRDRPTRTGALVALRRTLVRVPPNTSMPAPANLDDLRRQRQQLLERISWWEDHRHSALIPLVLACFGVGYGLGWLAHILLGLPYQVGYLAAIACVIVSGRWLDRAFAPQRLDAIDGQIARLERAIKASSAAAPSNAASPR
jgi:hypothetical protein